jgi:hypothetical protein
MGSSNFACSCFGPETFCGTLVPPYPEPQWWIPDAIVLGIKTEQSAHGMDVEVLETLMGEPQVGEIIRVWGDCGLLCRHYPGAWQNGDTVVWALKYTDLAGNGACGTSLEQEGEYMLSICGTYFLNYSNGMVSGPIAEGVELLPYDEFGQFISTCMAMALPAELGLGKVTAWCDGNHIILQPLGEDALAYELYDLQGRMITQGRTSVSTTYIPVGTLSAGIHVLKVSTGRHSETLRIPVP